MLFQLEEDEEDFERGDLNNNKTEFTVDSNDREFTSYQCKNPTTLKRTPALLTKDLHHVFLQSLNSEEK